MNTAMESLIDGVGIEAITRPMGKVVFGWWLVVVSIRLLVTVVLSEQQRGYLMGSRTRNNVDINGVVDLVLI